MNKLFTLYKGWNKNFSLVHLKFNYIIKKHVSSVFTILRSPMAQKKFSKEQIGFRYYSINFKITIDSNIFINSNIFFTEPAPILYFLILLRVKFYEIFCGSFMFNGVNIIIYLKYYFKPVWFLLNK